MIQQPIKMRLMHVIVKALCYNILYRRCAMDIILSRRSIKEYDDRIIPEQTIFELIRAGDGCAFGK